MIEFLACWAVFGYFFFIMFAPNEYPNKKMAVVWIIISGPIGWMIFCAISGYTYITARIHNIRN